MPTWPSATKAGTTNVDNPNDLVANARADIKQNIDNVNDIIDTFNISSPSDGDLLQYSSSTGQWEQVANTDVGRPTDFAQLGFSSATSLVSGNTYRKPVSSEFDPNGFVTTTVSSTTFSLPAGNYIFNTVVTTEQDDEAPVVLYNESDSSSIGNLAVYNEIGTTNTGIMSGSLSFTLTETKTFSLRQEAVNSNNRTVSIKINITKF